MHLIRVEKKGTKEVEHVLIEFRKEGNEIKMDIAIRFTDGTEASHEANVQASRYLFEMEDGGNDTDLLNDTELLD